MTDTTTCQLTPITATAVFDTLVQLKLMSPEICGPHFDLSSDRDMPYLRAIVHASRLHDSSCEQYAELVFGLRRLPTWTDDTQYVSAMFWAVRGLARDGSVDTPVLTQASLQLDALLALPYGSISAAAISAALQAETRAPGKHR